MLLRNIILVYCRHYEFRGIVPGLFALEIASGRQPCRRLQGGIVLVDDASDEGIVNLYYHISYFNTATPSLRLSSISRRYALLVQLFCCCALYSHFCSNSTQIPFYMQGAMTSPTGFLVNLSMYYLRPFSCHFVSLFCNSIKYLKYEFGGVDTTCPQVFLIKSF